MQTIPRFGSPEDDGSRCVQGRRERRRDCDHGLTLANYPVSNTAGTGIGSYGDSSLSFASQSQAGSLATELVSLTAVNGTGKYYVNYAMGIVWAYVGGV